MGKAKNAQTENQLSFLPAEAPQSKPKPTRCDGCDCYAPLKEPYHYEKEGHPQGITVYGFCAKNVKSRFSFYPVYLPDGGVCKDFKKRTQPSASKLDERASDLLLEVLQFIRKELRSPGRDWKDVDDYIFSNLTLTKSELLDIYSAVPNELVLLDSAAGEV